MKNTKRWAMILAIVLAVLMVASLFLSIVQSYAATQMDTLKSRRKDLAAEKKRIEAEIQSIKSEKKMAIQQKWAIDKLIDTTEQEIENAQALVSEYTILIADQQVQYEAAVKAQGDKQARFLDRVRIMEEAGETSYISILMNSSNFSDMLGRVSIVAEIAEYDQKVIEDLKIAKDKIARAKVELESQKVEQQETMQLLTQRQSELVAQYQASDKLIADMEANQKQYEQDYEEARKAEDEMQAQIAKLQAELARKSKKGYVGGDFGWPVPGYPNVSSEYGYRKHPILKTQKLHTGMDIAAPTGTTIVAANAGTVIVAKYNGGYGNCVVIDHGGGFATLYGHNSKLLVKTGQEVKKGQKIALCGSTGLSTGPHCHFEVIKDGKRVNPRTLQ